MHDVIRLKQVEHVKNEKNILQERKKQKKNFFDRKLSPNKRLLRLNLFLF